MSKILTLLNQFGAADSTPRQVRPQRSCRQQRPRCRAESPGIWKLLRHSAQPQAFSGIKFKNVDRAFHVVAFARPGMQFSDHADDFVTAHISAACPVAAPDGRRTKLNFVVSASQRQNASTSAFMSKKSTLSAFVPHCSGTTGPVPGPRDERPQCALQACRERTCSLRKCVRDLAGAQCSQPLQQPCRATTIARMTDISERSDYSVPGPTRPRRSCVRLSVDETVGHNFLVIACDQCRCSALHFDTGLGNRLKRRLR